MALVLKKLVTESSSVVVPYLRRPPNHPRHFFAEARFLLSEVRSILKELSPRNIIFGCPSSLAHSFTRKVLDNAPHTLRVTSRVTGEDARGLSGGDEDVTLGSSMKFSLHTPGIEKITETPEDVHVFIDMGLDKNWVDDDLDVNEFSALITKKFGIPNILLVEGHVQKLDIRRNFTALAYLPPNIKAASDDNFLILTKNGGVDITIPKADSYDDFLILAKNGGIDITIPKLQKTAS